MKYEPKYFTIGELTASETARKRGIDNTPTAEVEAHMLDLIENVLDPLRRAWGKPITVNSGYRCAKLNNAVGGVSTSQHVKGEAADITAGSPAENEKLFKLAINMDLPYDQLIDERSYRWLHVSYSTGHVRHQILHLK